MTEKTIKFSSFINGLKLKLIEKLIEWLKRYRDKQK